MRLPPSAIKAGTRRFRDDDGGDGLAADRSGSVGPYYHIVHGWHDRRGLLAIEFGKPVDEQAQPLRNLAGLFVEKDTEPVADFIADGAAMSAVYLQRQGFLARHDPSLELGMSGDNKPKILRSRRRFWSNSLHDRNWGLTSQKRLATRFGGCISRKKRSAGQARQAT
jgi:hypothetical protein